MGVGVSGLGFRARVHFRGSSLGFRVYRAQDVGLRVLGLGCRHLQQSRECSSCVRVCVRERERERETEKEKEREIESEREREQKSERESERETSTLIDKSRYPPLEASS